MKKVKREAQGLDVSLESSENVPFEDRPCLSEKTDYSEEVNQELNAFIGMDSEMLEEIKRKRKRRKMLHKSKLADIIIDPNLKLPFKVKKDRFLL
jgi:hypothetical protein